MRCQHDGRACVLHLECSYSGVLGLTRSSAQVALSSSNRLSFADRTTRLSSSLSDESDPTRNLRMRSRQHGWPCWRAQGAARGGGARGGEGTQDQRSLMCCDERCVDRETNALGGAALVVARRIGIGIRL